MFRIREKLFSSLMGIHSCIFRHCKFDKNFLQLCPFANLKLDSLYVLTLSGTPTSAVPGLFI